MQVLIPCLIFLAVENVNLVRNEHLDAQEVLDSTQFKNAVAKELLKKKLSNLESARQQDSLASFLRKGGKNLSGLRTAPKSSFHKDDDPSRKQAQMANTFIASSNLLFGTKSQQRKCNTGGKQTNKEVLDMRSLRQTYSGYNEDGGDFSAPKETPKLGLDTLNESVSAALQKRSYPKRVMQDPISCYLNEPKKVTCMHKDIIYKIALPSSEVADDEIGRIVESIYRAVEGKSSGKASLDESIEGTASQKTSLEDSAQATDSKKTSDDSLKKKRASEDYLKSLFLNNLLVANHKAPPNYNGNNPVFIPLLIPMAQPKLDPPKAPGGYYSGMAIDPRLQIPMNLSVGMDTMNNYQTGRNVMFDNGYGQYLVPEGFALPELNLKQRSQVNLTAEEEKRRNWLALMATNGLVPVENGMNPEVLTQHSANGEVQSVAEEKESISNGNKLTVAETGEVLDKLLNKRQQRDTYFLRRQLRRKPIMEEKAKLTPFYGDGRKQVLTKVVQKLSDPGSSHWEDNRNLGDNGCPCPCPCPSDLCASSKNPRKPTKCSPRYPVKLNFQLTTIQPSNTVQCSTTRCTKKVTCPNGCQTTPSCPCETTSCKRCSTKSDMCGDSDILSRVVSGAMNGNEERPVQKFSPPPVQNSHLNWLPYLPQPIPQIQPQYSGPLHQSATQMDRDNQQPYLVNGNGESQQQQSANAMGKQLQYSEQPKANLPQSSGKSIEETDYSGPFKHHNQPESNLVRNQIQVNYKQLPVDQGPNMDSPSHTIEGTVIHDVDSKQNELQNKPVPQAEHNNAASRQNDAKTKKHRDSFFARLRSKFHKGILPNGTDFKRVSMDGSHENAVIQNRALLGTSIFKFSPRNQTSGSGKNSSSNNTVQTMDNQQCLEDQTNHGNDQTLTLNQTQPSTVNNINITIASMQPQPCAQGLQPNNQSNQPPKSSKNNHCSNRPTTTHAVSKNNGENSRICKVTKIWLCSQRSSINMTVSSNSTCTQPTTDETNQSSCQTTQSTCQTTQSTCQTTQTSTCQTTSSTCKTSPITYQTTTPKTCPTTPSTCSNFGNESTSENPQTQPANPEGGDEAQPPTCDAETPSTSTCGAEIPPGSSLPQPENPWSPGDSQMPPGVPRPPPDTSQGSPGAKIKTFFGYGPYPGWSQWQYPMDRMNAHPPEQNFNWQQQTRVPLPTLYIPQVPQHDPRTPLSTTFPPQVPHDPRVPLSTIFTPQVPHDPRVPPPTPFTQAPHLKQPVHNSFPPPPPRNDAPWNQNLAQPQMHAPVWQQVPSRQLELDPRWQNVQPTDDSSSGRGQPVGNGLQYQQGMNFNPYNENKWNKSNKTAVGGKVRGMRKAHLPASIERHIARVRRYLLKKRPKISKHPLAIDP